MNKKGKIGLGFGIIILIFMSIMITVPLSSNPSTNSKTNYDIGDVIKLQGINIKIVKTETSNEDFWNTPDGTFFHVYVTIENMSKTTKTFSPIQFVLLDEKGREFNHKYFFTNNENAIWTATEIQPNLPITKFVTFDVPFDPNLKYELKIINAGNMCLRNC